MSSYILYSSHTSLTAPRLAEELNIPCGTSPRAADLIIAYGAGSNWTVPAGVRKVINHPRNVKNKLETLSVLQNANIAVAKFASAASVRQALQRRQLRFPLIGRRLVHQAGSGFYFCRTLSDVDIAIRNSAAYFQNAEEIESEYRVQVLGDSAPITYKKELRANPRDDLIRDVVEETRERYTITPTISECLNWALKRMAKAMTLPDLQIRSSSRGWYFNRVNRPQGDLSNIAIRAIRAMGLDFGAVDVMKTHQGEIKIIEINTGPGMDVGGLTFRTYVNKFREWVQQYGNALPRPRPISTASSAANRRAAVSSGGRTNVSSRRSSESSAPRSYGQRVIRVGRV